MWYLSGKKGSRRKAKGSFSAWKNIVRSNYMKLKESILQFYCYFYSLNTCRIKLTLTEWVVKKTQQPFNNQIKNHKKNIIKLKSTFQWHAFPLQIKTVTFYVTIMKMITCNRLLQVRYQVLTFLLLHLVALMVAFSFPVVSASVVLVLVKEGCGVEVACSHLEVLALVLQVITEIQFQTVSSWCQLSLSCDNVRKITL